MKQIEYDSFMAELPVSVLLTGLYGVGKTYMMGSAVAHESQRGKGLIVHIGGEPSFASLGGHDLSHTDIYTMEEYDDFKALESSWDHTPYDVIGVDSLEALVELAADQITGGERSVGEGRGEYSRSEWGQLKFRVFRALARLNSMGKLIIATCPLVMRTNQITGEETAAPNLPGQQAYAIVGRFSFVGVLSARTINANSVKRTINFAPSNRYQTRCNSVTPIVKPIPVPNGPDAWLPIKDAITNAIRRS